MEDGKKGTGRKEEEDIRKIRGKGCRKMRKHEEKIRTKGKKMMKAGKKETGRKEEEIKKTREKGYRKMAKRQEESKNKKKGKK